MAFGDDASATHHLTTRVVSTPRGEAEVAERGTGIPVVVLHGSPGGIDAAELMSRFLPEGRFRTILLSRPGYLGTPLGHADSSIDAEAELVAAVLDEFGVTRAGVLAWSGGGPAAYRLAVLHPERVSGIVAIAALTGKWTPPKATLSDRLLSASVFGAWAIKELSRYAPEQVIEGALSGEGSLRGDELTARVSEVLADPVKRDFVLGISATSNSAGRRHAGWTNDVANFGGIGTLELAAVAAPVLLFHGDADTDAAPRYSAEAAAELPHGELVTLPGATHLGFYTSPHADDAQRRAQEFLAAHAGAVD